MLFTLVLVLLCDRYNELWWGLHGYSPENIRLRKFPIHFNFRRKNGIIIIGSVSEKVVEGHSHVRCTGVLRSEPDNFV
jgi:hypothetical protein